MNKDVIYIEPEDDITDIITKIENSKEKIVAVVPPKKAGVFRSIVNIKLIVKSATAAKKTVVLVTTDPSIVKIAATTKLPVTKDLQSAPTIPKISQETEEIEKAEVKENTNEGKDDSIDEEEDVQDNSKKKDDKDDDIGEDDGGGKNSKNKLVGEKKNKKKRSNNKVVEWVQAHKKIVVASGIGVVLLILLLVWMFVIAPSVSVTVDIKTDVNNFSEAVTFVARLDEENADEGKFYLEERKNESEEKIEFEATGTKNIGEKAKGAVVVYASINHRGGVVVVNAGDTFTNNGLSFVADAGARMEFDGEDLSVCANEDVPAKEFREQGCRIYKRIDVTATAPGASYNIAATDSGWSTTAPVGVYSDSAMSGGTDEMITVVSKSDIDKAKSKIEAADEKKNKERLLDELSENLMAIDSSFVQEIGDAVSVPAVDEKVESGVKPTLTVVTVTRIYALDKTKIEEFIREKAKLEESQKIYEIKSPFIENFMKTDNGYTGKLKTSYAVGPKITENDVIEVIKGKGLGEAQHDLRDISGVTSVRIDKSFPWVMSVPGDVNKITVNLDIKEQ